MNKKVEKHISLTAFMVNESRWRRMDVSQDKIAQKWLPDELRSQVAELWDDFAREVYPHDDLVLAVRNRYFLERLQKLISSNPSAVFVNLAAGFTSYPFLVDSPVRTLEVDFSHITLMKRQRIDHLLKDGIITNRPVQFFDCDLNDVKSHPQLESKLVDFIEDNPSFILMEGITYYLTRNSFISLIDLFGRCQRAGSVVAMDYWKSDMLELELAGKLSSFFEKRFGYSSDRYHFLDPGFLRDLPGYEIVDSSDVIREEPVYAGTSTLAEAEEVLIENYSVHHRN